MLFYGEVIFWKRILRDKVPSAGHVITARSAERRFRPIPCHHQPKRRWPTPSPKSRSSRGPARAPDQLPTTAASNQRTDTAGLSCRVSLISMMMVMMMTMSSYNNAAWFPTLYGSKNQHPGWAPRPGSGAGRRQASHTLAAQSRRRHFAHWGLPAARILRSQSTRDARKKSRRMLRRLHSMVEEYDASSFRRLQARLARHMVQRQDHHVDERQTRRSQTGRGCREAVV